MQNLLDLMSDILKNGVDKDDRTGVGSRAVFGRLLRWDLSKGFPIQTTRQIALRFAFEETMFFLRGETNTKLLEEKKINIWKSNTSREFLDNRGLHHLPEGSIGTGYSHAWRNFGGDLGSNNGVDQIFELLEGLKSDPFGRRHLVTGWNPAQLSGTPLPPCHMLQLHSVEPEQGEFTVGNDKLHTCFFMRSNDVPFGLPYNIMGYALLNHMFAKHLGLVPGELVYMGWDVHIYKNQMKMVEELLTRTPRDLPSLIIKKDLPSFNDILELQWEDIELIGYDPHPDIKHKPPMAT